MPRHETWVVTPALLHLGRRILLLPLKAFLDGGDAIKGVGLVVAGLGCYLGLAYVADAGVASVINEIFARAGLVLGAAVGLAVGADALRVWSWRRSSGTGSPR